MPCRSPFSLLVAALLVLLIQPSLLRAQGTKPPVVRDTNVGYIDPAIPGDVFRLRLDAAYDNLRPNRDEFFWAAGPPFGRGPRIPESSVNYQDIAAYCETLVAPAFSAFANVPVRFLDPQQNANATGLADVDAGVKFALIDEPDLVTTFQFRTYAPSADFSRGLGTGHVSLEPAFLAYLPLGDYWGLEGEVRDWIPVGGSSFAGNIIRYGLGAHCNLLRTSSWSVTPVAEFVGWTALDGKVSVREPTGLVNIEDATGATIINAKVGLRIRFERPGDLYVGYGRPLTGNSWYLNTFRVELRFFF